jgi:hypothetical protein
LCEQIAVDGKESSLFKGLLMDEMDAVSDARGYLRQNYQTANSFVAIAHRHKVVNELAKSMRYAVYKKKEEPPEPGELIRVTGTKDYDGSWLVLNNTIIEVSYYSPEGVTGRTAKGEIVSLPIDSSGELAQLKQAAIEAKEPKVWSKYYKEKMMYTEVKSPWAKTVYSLQGSTYTRSLVNTTDVLSAQDSNALYVAVSRSEQLPWMFDL